jgi:putative ABC transport system substrate-binding protein
MRPDRLRRRKFIRLLGGAAATWPLAARAQQPAVPVIGYLSSVAAGGAPASRLAAFRQGLAETGYIEGRTVAVEYRWAEGRNDRLPELAADLVRRRVSVIVTLGTEPGARAAMAATATIPIVFGVGTDPVELGLVARLNQPGGNATGYNFFTAELVAKRVGLMRELLPGARRIGVLVNPRDPQRAKSVTINVETAARSLGQQVYVLTAGTSDEIDEALVAFARERVDALFVGPDPFFNSRRVQFAVMTARHVIPATYAARDYVEAGGLLSYGADVTEMFRQAGVYAGKILKGAKPGDLPVVQSTKFELVISRPAAKAVGLELPPTLLAIADEVIE